MGPSVLKPPQSLVDMLSQASERRQQAQKRLATAQSLAASLHASRPAGGNASKRRRSLDRLEEILLVSALALAFLICHGYFLWAVRRPYVTILCNSIISHDWQYSLSV